MLCFECLFNITRYALFTDNFRILTDWTVLKSGISSFTLFFPFPNRGEVDFALSTTIRLLRQVRSFVLGKIVNDIFEPQQVHEFGIARVRNEVHLRRWRLWRWDLQ